MPPKQEPADILAFANVQHAIGDLIQEVARDTGIADRHALRMRTLIVDRIASGSPVDSAIRLVQVINEATIPESPAKAKDPFPWQEDTRKLLLALGLGDHARPGSCHDVIVGEVLPALNRLVARALRAPAEGGETGRTLEANKGLSSDAEFRSGGGIGRD